jgi:hypothetical protein
VLRAIRCGRVRASRPGDSGAYPVWERDRHAWIEASVVERRSRRSSPLRCWRPSNRRRRHVRGWWSRVEVNAAPTLRASDWRWLKKLADERGVDFRAGIVVYAGAQTVPLGSRLWAVPYSGLWA